MKLSKEQFERESCFRLAMAVATALLTKDLLTKEEFYKIKKRYIEKYNPIWGHLPDVLMA